MGGDDDKKGEQTESKIPASILTALLSACRAAYRDLPDAYYNDIISAVLAYRVQGRREV